MSVKIGTNTKKRKLDELSLMWLVRNLDLKTRD